MKDKLNITVCLDKGFIMPTGVMMYSICANNQDVDIAFYVVIDDSVTLKDKDKLKDNLKRFESHVSMDFFQVKEICAKLPSTANRQGLSNATYFRLFLADFLPCNIDKVLYLDGDIIIRHSLLSLWNTDLTNYAIAAVSDSFYGDVDYDKRLGYPLDAGYFNAGVLLINLKYWRENNVTQRFINYIEERYSYLTFHDQDILNGVFWNKKIRLPIKYNLHSGFLCKDFFVWGCNMQEVKEAEKDPIIVHYSGFFRPWESYIRTPHPYGSSFYKYQRMTIWKDYRIETRSSKLKIKNFLTDSLRHIKLLHSISDPYVSTPQID